MNDDRKRLDDILAATAEATKALSTETTGAMPDVPRRAFAGMRDRTIHRYPDVDLDIVWNTLVEDLPALTDRIQTYLRSADRPETDSGK